MVNVKDMIAFRTLAARIQVISYLNKWQFSTVMHFIQMNRRIFQSWKVYA